MSRSPNIYCVSAQCLDPTVPLNKALCGRMHTSLDAKVYETIEDAICATTRRGSVQTICPDCLSKVREALRGDLRPEEDEDPAMEEGRYYSSATICLEPDGEHLGTVECAWNGFVQTMRATTVGTEFEVTDWRCIADGLKRAAEKVEQFGAEWEEHEKS